MDLVAFFIFRWSLLLFETVFASIPFFAHKEKHKYHYLRIIACITIDIGLIVGLSFFQYFIFSTFGFDKLYYTIFGLAYYLIFFGFHVASIQLIFKGKLYDNFSLITKSYAIRQLAFVIYILIVHLVNVELNFLSINYVTWQNGLIYASIFIVVYLVSFYLIFKLQKEPINNTLEKPILLFYGLIILINIVINSMTETYSLDNKDLYILLMFSQLFSLILILAIDEIIRRNNNLKIENYLNDQMLRHQEMQYKYAKENVEQLRIKAHDLKHQVRILKEGGDEAKKLISELENDISSYDSIYITDNQVLNLILSEKWGYSRKHGITLTPSIAPNAFKNVETSDLYSLFGNILDNAIEAVLKIKEKDKRVISLEINNKNSLSYLKCVNYFKKDELDTSSTNLKTTKKDKINHGFGLKSIEYITKKYKGQMNINVEEDLFSLTIMIPDLE